MTRPTGVEIYRGPSQLDGAPIVAIATGLTRPSVNRKTGPVVQVWIMPQHAAPHETLRDGSDASVCGDCPLRGLAGKGRACYVDLPKAPLGVWRAWRADRYPRWDGSPFARKMRLGAWGDPAALPIGVLESLTRAAPLGWTGYTHQWRNLTGRKGARYRSLIMASADSEADGRTARARGWRTFRVLPKGDRQPSGSRPREIVCPATTPGSTTTCETCGACNGSTGRADRRVSIVVEAHGPGAMAHPVSR